MSTGTLTAPSLERRGSQRSVDQQAKSRSIKTDESASAPVPAPAPAPAPTYPPTYPAKAHHPSKATEFTQLRAQTPSPPPAPFSASETDVEPQLIPTPPQARQYLDGHNTAFRVLFISIACAAQLLTQMQFGAVVIALDEVAAALGATSEGDEAWLAATYGLTVGMFLLPAGRLGDMYGPKLLWLGGMGLMVIFNIASGFCKQRISFDICRALSGVGAASALPNAIAMIGRTYPPGRMRTMIFSILGSLGPVGFASGGAIAAVLADLVHVKWIWFVNALICTAVVIIGLKVLPPDDPIPPSSQQKPFDTIGTILLCTGLGLFNICWNQSAVTGWEETYVWVMLLVAIIAFLVFYLWEKRMGDDALIPTEVLGKNGLMVYMSLWTGWMSFGVFLFYTIQFIRNIRGQHSALAVIAQMSPVLPGGATAALMVPYMINRFPVHQIFLLSMCAFLVGDVMASVAPANGSYWSVTFPSLLLVIVGPDMSYATGQIIVSNSVSREFQGVAGGLVGMIANYSLSIGLGMAGTVERYIRGSDGTILKGYRAAFYFGTGLAALSVVIVAGFVRVPKLAQHRE